MSAMETDTVMASVISSLTSSFKEVPVTASPAIIDCILASTCINPSSLFASLLESCNDLVTTQVLVNQDQKLDSSWYNHVSVMVGALCHLLKKLGSDPNSLQAFIWKGFVPLMKINHASNCEMLNQIAESFFNVISITDSWNILETTLIPFLLRSVGMRMGMHQNGEQDVFEWDKCSGVQNPKNSINDINLDKETIHSLYSSFPLAISCYILTLILDAALHNFQEASRRELLVANSSCDCERLIIILLHDLCNTSEQLLSHSSEHRSCAVVYLLPVLFKAFLSQYLSEIPVLGSQRLSRKMWKCCKSLFNQGSLERRDAYTILSLYLSFFSSGEGCNNEQLDVGEEKFDIRKEIEFWDEIKKGLVGGERLVRKQSLRILRAVLQINGEIQWSSSSEKKSQERPNQLTKREVWAHKEAKSLGVDKLQNLVDSQLDSQQQWEAFILLYEMLEEYGTHLVEAAWNHQVTLLLHYSVSDDNFASYVGRQIYEDKFDTSSESFSWLTILWQLGFQHDNPQVRCLIMESFLAIEWMNYGASIQSLPQSFVLGPFVEGLNDPVHHKDFGVKGVYSSGTIEGAAKFLRQYSSYLEPRKGIHFLHNLASVDRYQSLGRAGLMALSECIASAAHGIAFYGNKKAESREDYFSNGIQPEVSPSCNDRTELLDVLRCLIESSKQHFNPNYRLRVCEKILDTSSLIISTSDIPLEALLHFISSLPREFTDLGGLLRETIQKWVVVSEKKQHIADSSAKIQLLKSLHDFTEGFTHTQYTIDAPLTFDDVDLNLWESEAKRWARVLLLVIKGPDQLETILEFIRSYGTNICKQCNHFERSPVKFLILITSLVGEIQMMQERAAELGLKARSRKEVTSLGTLDELTVIKEKSCDTFLFIVKELVLFAEMSCSVFWSGIVKDTSLPSSVKGQLGGPSQRRLPSSVTSNVLQAIMSIRAIASITSWCQQLKTDIRLSPSWTFLWNYLWKTVSHPIRDSETQAEIHLAAYEALSSVTRALVSTPWPQALHHIGGNLDLTPPTSQEKPLLDMLVLTFLERINSLLAVTALARTRKAVLLNWKWFCLESLLSIPHCAFRNGFRLENNTFFSDMTIKHIFNDVVESLENAGEDSTLSILRSTRLAMDLFASEKSSVLVSSCNGVDAQMIWRLVHSSWILHLSSNKRRVACIAALLSSVLHSSVFVEEAMHLSAGEMGPLKWFIGNVLEEGTKSPRTIRLSALHLTGLWLSHPATIRHYLKELKLLTLYGSVAFDEDFEAEIAENDDARNEVSLLAKLPEAELTEVFINTELYARVSVAVLFQKLADLVISENENKDCLFALESGKLFLLELLDSAVTEKDLAKELYKKYSAIHRRKVRVWQMICVLSRFVTTDILGQVMESLHTALYRNNLPGVRQYLETFAINIYLRFPTLVGEQLVPILQDCNMRPQALSSYVFIAANVILHAPVSVQFDHLNTLLPPIIPLLTSHHHSLRGFTQLLVHQVFHEIFPLLKCEDSETIALEKRCFEELKMYLANNQDCRRLRASMEGHLDAYDPVISSTPAGIFVNRVEDIEFECVPLSIMEEVLNFLNDVREDLRSSMAKDVVTIRNESLQVEDLSLEKRLPDGQQLEKTSKDFQRKIGFSKHDLQDTDSSFIFGNESLYKQLLAIEQEDGLLDHSLRFRSLTMEKLRASRQEIILVASFLDRIPNLAGLARTCEVFKASGLVIADASILRDKQFQLISVTAEKWVPITEVPVNSVKQFLEKKKRQGFSILGLEQTANSKSLDQYTFPKKTVLVLGREKEGIPVDIIHILDTCIEIPQLGIVRSLNVHVSGAIALWEYTRQQRSQ